MLGTDGLIPTALSDAETAFLPAFLTDPKRIIFSLLQKLRDMPSCATNVYAKAAELFFNLNHLGHRCLVVLARYFDGLGEVPH